MMLDLESVRLFVLSAEYGNLTRAAEAAGTVQPVVSQRIKALEVQLGRRLLDRSPRLVRLTLAGEAFIVHARHLLEAHDAALSLDNLNPTVIRIGISDHALGTSFDKILRRVKLVSPLNAVITVKLGLSQDVRRSYEHGDVDLAIIRREGTGADGEVLGEDGLDWRALPGWARRNEPIPLITLPSPCGVRAAALKALDLAEIPWREVFVGGSCLALTAAVRAGLGVAPLGHMVAQSLPEAVVISDLPPLQPSQIVLLARTHNEHLAATARALASSVRESLQHPKG